jgi:formate dehydrogenase major subunit
MYRAPYCDQWVQRPLDWAMDRIAHLVKDTRDRDFIETSADGLEVNHLIAHLGGATLDNEENYLIKKLLTGGLLILAVETRRASDQRLGAWSGRLLRTRRSDHLSARSRQQRFVLIMGSNMAEAHPVGFRWALKAREAAAS